MTRITRYIFRQLVTGAIIVSLALGCIAWLTQSLRFLQLVVTKGLAVSMWLKLTLLQIPSLLVVVVPPAFFFVTLFVYNKLAIDRELVVAQAAGISRVQLTRPALLAAAVGAFACYVLTIYGAPHATSAFRELLWSIRNDASRILLREGAFNQLAAGLTVYVRSRGAAGELEGIMVHDARNPKRIVTVLAERGILAGTSASAAPHVLLINATRQELDRSGTKMSVAYFGEYTFDFDTLADASSDRRADYRERPLTQLLTLGPDQGVSDREAGRMRSEAHQRLAGPLTVFGFTVVALVFLLKSGFDRRGQLPRISAAVVALVVLEALWLGVADLVGKTPALAPLMYMVGLLPTAVGLYIIASPVQWFGAGQRGSYSAAST